MSSLQLNISKNIYCDNNLHFHGKYIGETKLICRCTGKTTKKANASGRNKNKIVVIGSYRFFFFNANSRKDISNVNSFS